MGGWGNMAVTGGYGQAPPRGPPPAQEEEFAPSLDEAAPGPNPNPNPKPTPKPGPSRAFRGGFGSMSHLKDPFANAAKVKATAAAPAKADGGDGAGDGAEKVEGPTDDPNEVISKRKAEWQELSEKRKTLSVEQLNALKAQEQKLLSSQAKVEKLIELKGADQRKMGLLAQIKSRLIEVQNQILQKEGAGGAEKGRKKPALSLDTRRVVRVRGAPADTTVSLLKGHLEMFGKIEAIIRLPMPAAAEGEEGEGGGEARHEFYVRFETRKQAGAAKTRGRSFGGRSTLEVDWHEGDMPETDGDDDGGNAGSLSPVRTSVAASTALPIGS